MDDTKQLPFRQKAVIAQTILVGLFMCLAYLTRILEPGQLNMLILFYSMGVPMVLLVFDTLTDLDNKRVFTVWLFIGLVQFCVYLLTRDNADFRIERSAGFDPHGFPNRYISDISTSALKTLLVFLCAYKICNTWMKRYTGYSLLNTYRQKSWSHFTKNRRISAWDVLMNILLCLVIVISALTR